MKILLVNPISTSNKRFSSLVRLTNSFFISSSYSLKQIKWISPDFDSVKIVDEAFDKINFGEKYDLVGISCVHTNSAFRSYEIADEFRRRGVKVVLGGWHPSVLPNEAKEHADSVIIGEAEYSWPQLISDYNRGELKHFYKQPKPTDPNDIGIIDHSRFRNKTVGCSLQATRGCPYQCSFCSISNQKFGCVYRKRPVDDVIKEIKTIPNKNLSFSDTSFSINPKYSKSLFKQMIGLNKKFRCWMNANIPLDDKFLRLTSEAGCIAVEMGFETLSKRTLNSINKKTNNLDYYKEIINRLHDYGISVGGTFVFGFDADTKDVFDKTLENLYSLDIDFPRFAILTPYPGTPLFERLKNEKRIITYNWEKYDMINVVFQPKNMTPEELKKGWLKVCEEIYAIRSINKRVIKVNGLKFNSWLWKILLNYIEKIR